MFNHKALYPMKSAIMFILFLLPIIYFKWKCEKIKPVRPSYHVYYLIYFNLWQGKIKWQQPVKSSFRKKKMLTISFQKKKRKNFLYSLKLTAAFGGELIFHRHIWYLIFDSNIILYTDRGTAG